ncbi:MAG: recombinase family protein, partial [Oscillibacter sp.]
YFPQKNVRFIAVNDGVDSTVESSNDFNPIRNWANELHAKDTSRKVRAVMKMKAEQGERLGGRPPYGYRKSDGDANTLVPDEDTAPVVKRIFSLCAAGNGPKRIATILTKGAGGEPVQRLLPQDREKPPGTGHHQTMPVVFQQRHQHSEQ